MPRCQNSFRPLGVGTTAPGAGVGVWMCQHCEAHETYSTVRDPALLSYAATAKNAAVLDFSAPSDPASPTLLIWGTRPECVYEPASRSYDIYLATDSDPWQARLQIGHELFHRVAGEGRVFHWTHEMLACVFAVRLLRRTGFGEYGSRIAAQYAVEAETCPLPALLDANPWGDAAYPSGYYGRAFVTGIALQTVVGYAALCRLARLLCHAGVPDIAAWRETLPRIAQETPLLRFLSSVAPTDA
ncbi:MAG: hypothetical protein H7Y38_20950 [Armatimonadetes bacterium]|nr:hypothetical protein [Armatimonadota bacterium]